MLSLESRKRRTSRAICWPAPERHGRSAESGAACAKLQSPLVKNKMRTAVRIGVTAAALILMWLYSICTKLRLSALRSGEKVATPTYSAKPSSFSRKWTSRFPVMHIGARTDLGDGRSRAADVHHDQKIDFWFGYRPIVRQRLRNPPNDGDPR